MSLCDQSVGNWQQKEKREKWSRLMLKTLCTAVEHKLHSQDVPGSNPTYFNFSFCLLSCVYFKQFPRGGAAQLMFIKN